MKRMNAKPKTSRRRPTVSRAIQERERLKQRRPDVVHANVKGAEDKDTKMTNYLSSLCRRWSEKELRVIKMLAEGTDGAEIWLVRERRPKLPNDLTERKSQHKIERDADLDKVERDDRHKAADTNNITRAMDEKKSYRDEDNDNDSDSDSDTESDLDSNDEDEDDMDTDSDTDSEKEENPNMVALQPRRPKYVLKLVDTHPQNVARVSNEAKALSVLRHPYIVGLYGFIKTEHFVGLLLEYAAKGDLLEMCRDGDTFKPLPVDRQKRYVAQLADALSFCRLKEYLHGDIKPENILIDEHDNVKLADFGGAIALSLDERAQCKRPEVIGTYEFMAPELSVYLIGIHPPARWSFTSQSDMWSLGILIFELCSGELPFLRRCGNSGYTRHQVKLIQRKIQKVNAVIKQWPDLFNKQVDLRQVPDLVQRLLCLDPNKRLTPNEVLQHSWFGASRRPVTPALGL